MTYLYQLTEAEFYSLSSRKTKNNTSEKSKKYGLSGFRTYVSDAIR